ncbi:MAG TPA: GntR family transcriptional regulator [Deltaproteobacteria bacterium]|mgnify:CR=1 FL=1|nr:GntR family transcriptional regulator [Deltaproteobacteria bacterium]HPP81466.1 GntR family transcriptional regulator [Deltaproteobacteria bacterium]
MGVKVSERICLELQKAIFRGEYPPNSRLPSERELARRFEASRAAVREAVVHLSEIGLVRTLPQSGTYVTDYLSEASLELLVGIMKNTDAVDAGVLVSLLRLRRITAPVFARDAALNADEDSVDRLKEAGENLVEAIRRRPRSKGALSECDFRFHLEIARMTRDILFHVLFNSFRPIYRHYTDIYYSLPGSREATVPFVRDLTDAVAGRDPDRAERIMRDAVEDAEARLTSALGLSRAGAPFSGTS